MVAEAENGFFCLLPQHVDFTAAARAGHLCLSRPATGRALSRRRRGHPREEGRRGPRLDPQRRRRAPNWDSSRTSW
ncbi:MAG: hypothetical protein MZV70_04820 [Desulfobacterales bacterium]|nr:hypothetical protein [Desulfobacterales bacterium]